MKRQLLEQKTKLLNCYNQQIYNDSTLKKVVNTYFRQYVREGKNTFVSFQLANGTTYNIACHYGLTGFTYYIATIKDDAQVVICGIAPTCKTEFFGVLSPSEVLFCTLILEKALQKTAK